MDISDAELTETHSWKPMVDALCPMVNGAAWTKFSHSGRYFEPWLEHNGRGLSLLSFSPLTTIPFFLSSIRLFISLKTDYLVISLSYKIDSSTSFLPLFCIFTVTYWKDGNEESVKSMHVLTSQEDEGKNLSLHPILHWYSLQYFFLWTFTWSS